jgi:hypothetical protein
VNNTLRHARGPEAPVLELTIHEALAQIAAQFPGASAPVETA